MPHNIPWPTLDCTPWPENRELPKNMASSATQKTLVAFTSVLLVFSNNVQAEEKDIHPTKATVGSRPIWEKKKCESDTSAGSCGGKNKKEWNKLNFLKTEETPSTNSHKPLDVDLTELQNASFLAGTDDGVRIKKGQISNPNDFLWEDENLPWKDGEKQDVSSAVFRSMDKIRKTPHRKDQLMTVEKRGNQIVPVIHTGVALGDDGQLRLVSRGQSDLDDNQSSILSALGMDIGEHGQISVFGGHLKQGRGMNMRTVAGLHPYSVAEYRGALIYTYRLSSPFGVYAELRVAANKSDSVDIGRELHTIKTTEGVTTFEKHRFFSGQQDIEGQGVLRIHGSQGELSIGAGMVETTRFDANQARLSRKTSPSLDLNYTSKLFGGYKGGTWNVTGGINGNVQQAELGVAFVPVSNIRVNLAVQGMKGAGVGDMTGLGGMFGLNVPFDGPSAPIHKDNFLDVNEVSGSMNEAALGILEMDARREDRSTARGGEIMDMQRVSYVPTVIVPTKPPETPQPSVTEKPVSVQKPADTAKTDTTSNGTGTSTTKPATDPTPVQKPADSTVNTGTGIPLETAPQPSGGNQAPAGTLPADTTVQSGTGTNGSGAGSTGDIAGTGNSPATGIPATGAVNNAGIGTWANAGTSPSSNPVTPASTAPTDSATQPGTGNSAPAPVVTSTPTPQPPATPVVVVPPVVIVTPPVEVVPQPVEAPKNTIPAPSITSTTIDAGWAFSPDYDLFALGIIKTLGSSSTLVLSIISDSSANIDDTRGTWFMVSRIIQDPPIGDTNLRVTVRDTTTGQESAADITIKNIGAAR